MIIYFRSVFLSLLLLFPLISSALTVHDLAPEIEGVELNSEATVNLKSYLGRVVFIDFWASWCVPCRRSLPQLNLLRNALKNEGFEVIAINLDENIQDAKHFIARYPLQFPILTKVANSQLAAYQIEGLPVSYLIAANGEVIQRFVGFKKSDVEKIKQLFNNETQ